MPDRTYEFVQLDVFTQTPLTGNPLAIFTDARGLDDGEMQAVAREMNKAPMQIYRWMRRLGIDPSAFR